MKSYTDLEQSRKLKNILPLESADMHYIIMGGDEDPQTIVGLGEYIGILPTIPAWSLSALIELLPDKITINNESYYLSFDKKSIAFRGPISWDGQKSKSFEMDDILDAAFEMICWLKENKKI